MTATDPRTPFAFDFEVRDADQLVVVRAQGELDLERLAVIGPRLHDHPGFGPGFGVIYDLTDCSAERVTMRDLEDLVELVRRRGLREGYRVAYVLPDDLGYGLGRVFAALADGVRGRRRWVTRSLDEAFDWMRRTPH